MTFISIFGHTEIMDNAVNQLPNAPKMEVTGTGQSLNKSASSSSESDLEIENMSLDMQSANAETVKPSVEVLPSSSLSKPEKKLLESKPPKLMLLIWLVFLGLIFLVMWRLSFWLKSSKTASLPDAKHITKAVGPVTLGTE